MTLDEESRKFTTINTHKDLFHYNRLPFGVSSAPGIFQRTMENLLQGIPQVTVRMDDILISGKGENAPIYTNGWPHHCQDVQLHPYLSRKAELTIESGCVLWGNRVIVPPLSEAPLYPWEWPGRPWARVHIDYAGPHKGHMHLVVIDALSSGLKIAVFLYLNLCFPKPNLGLSFLCLVL